MALNKQEARKTYVSISDGSLVIQRKEAVDNVTKSRLTKTNKLVHEEFFKSITAKITGIKSKTTDFGMFWDLTMVDSDGNEYVIGWQYSSRYTNNFFTVLPNIDLTKEVTLAPWSMKDKKDPEKKVTGITIYQNGKKIEKYYTMENPNGMPPMVKTKVKGKEVWDDSEQLEFFETLAKLTFAEAAAATEAVEDEIGF